MPQFNYKDIPIWLLSFFGVLFILSITDSIPSEQIADSVIKYSIFGIFISLISWSIELKISHVVEGKIEGEQLFPIIFKQQEIHRIKGESIKNRKVLISVLFITLLFFCFSVHFWPEIWVVIFLIMGICYILVVQRFKCPPF